MAERGRSRWLRPSALLAVLWLLEIVHLAAPTVSVTELQMAGLVTYVVIALVRGRWQTRALSGMLAAVAVLLSVLFDAWSAIPGGIEKALIFTAFLPTIVLLRATAEQRGEIAAARALFGSLDKDRRGGGILIGSHLLGSVLIIGVFALLAPLLGPDAPERERRRVVIATIRGMSLAVLWSPFFVGMAVASRHLPAVPLWQIMPLGLGFSALGLLISYLMFDRAGGMIGLWRSLTSLRPILPPVAVAALVVVALTALTPLTTLHALVLGMPVLCLAVLAAMGRAKLRTATAAAAEGLGNLGPEIAILTFAMVLGAVLEAALSQTGTLVWLQGLELAPRAVIATVIGIMTLGGLFAIHPIVTGTVLLVLFTSFPAGVSDLVLMESMLFGWGLGTMISVSSVSIATGSMLFRIAPERLVDKENLMFVVVFAALAVFILDGVNRLLAG